MPDATKIEPTRYWDWRRLIPRYWIQNEPTDRHWDALLNKLLDTQAIELAGPYTVKVGAARVWIENWPYSYGRTHGCELPYAGCLPTVRTRQRLRNAVAQAAALKARGEQ